MGTLVGAEVAPHRKIRGHISGHTMGGLRGALVGTLSGGVRGTLVVTPPTLVVTDTGRTGGREGRGDKRLGGPRNARAHFPGKSSERTPRANCPGELSASNCPGKLSGKTLWAHFPEKCAVQVLGNTFRPVVYVRSGVFLLLLLLFLLPPLLPWVLRWVRDQWGGLFGIAVPRPRKSKKRRGAKK